MRERDWGKEEGTRRKGEEEVPVYLQRKKGAARVHQVDTGKPVLHGNLLCPQLFLDADGVESPTLEGPDIG